MIELSNLDTNLWVNFRLYFLITYMGNLDACLAYIMLFIIMEMWVVFFFEKKRSNGYYCHGRLKSGELMTWCFLFMWELLVFFFIFWHVSLGLTCKRVQNNVIQCHLFILQWIQYIVVLPLFLFLVFLIWVLIWSFIRMHVKKNKVYNHLRLFSFFR